MLSNAGPSCLVKTSTSPTEWCSPAKSSSPLHYLRLRSSSEWIVSECLDCKTWSTGLVSKITRINSTGSFPLRIHERSSISGFCDELNAIHTESNNSILSCHSPNPEKCFNFFWKFIPCCYSRIGYLWKTLMILNENASIERYSLTKHGIIYILWACDVVSSNMLQTFYNLPVEIFLEKAFMFLFRLVGWIL